MKLASEKQAADARRWLMFQAFWLINATATFLFGLEFVGVVFVGLFAMLPIAIGTAETLGAVTGGIASLAVLDVAYKGWMWQAMNTAETMKQVTIARAMGWFAFLLSCAYSAIVLVLAMPLFGLTSEQTAWVHLFGGVSFIVITIAHLLAAVVYEQSSIAYKEAAVLVNMKANMETERLDFVETVQRQALLQTRGEINTHADGLASEFQRIWAGELLASTRPKQLTQTVLSAPAPARLAAEAPADDVRLGTVTTNDDTAVSSAEVDVDDWQELLSGDTPRGADNPLLATIPTPSQNGRGH